MQHRVVDAQGWLRRMGQRLRSIGAIAAGSSPPKHPNIQTAPPHSSSLFHFARLARRRRVFGPAGQPQTPPAPMRTNEALRLAWPGLASPCRLALHSFTHALRHLLPLAVVCTSLRTRPRASALPWPNASGPGDDGCTRAASCFAMRVRHFLLQAS